jgi:hypothetical protein
MTVVLGMTKDSWNYEKSTGMTKGRGNGGRCNAGSKKVVERDRPSCEALSLFLGNTGAFMILAKL